ncbi:FAD-dependent monooxygenase [Nocardia sp. NPDC057227]|uniref:FAD-dependent monooxygenase n=1 Tax=Nocardia sp. NPDC057227 TaxID=3346056 RepID=UPI003625F07A
MVGPAKVVVLGAGIGGLTAAVALRQAGIGVEVYEAGPELRAQGSALSVQSNAIHALRTLGPELERELLERGARVESFRFARPDGKPLRELPVGKQEERLGAPSIAIHRADLHAALRTAVGDTPIHLDARATRFIDGPDHVRVEFADGRVADGTALIGADGIGSVVRAQLHGRAAPRPGGFVCWLACIPFEHAAVRPGSSTHYWGTGMRFGLHDIGHGRVYWWGTKTLPAAEAADWKGGKAELLELYAGWAPEVRACIEQTDSDAILAVPAQDRPPLTAWGRGRVTLLGDAAHPMLPALAQGANAAIEDAVALASALRSAVDPALGLRRYERSRIERSAMFVDGSRSLSMIEQTTDAKLVALRNTYFRLAPTEFFLRELSKPMSFPPLAGPVAELPRALTPAERWHWIADQLAPLHVVARARVHGTVEPAQLRAALAEVQRRHPALRVAVRAKPDGTEPEFVPAEREIPLREVTAADPEGWLAEIDGTELAEPFDTTAGPLARAVLVHAADGSGADLLITLHHAVGDGESALTVAEQVLRVAAGEAGEYPAAPVRPGAEELFPEGVGGNRHLASSVLRDQRARFTKAKRLRPTELAEPKLRRSRVLHRRIDGDRLEVLLARCAQHGVGVRAAVAAALIGATAREAGVEEPATYAIGSLLNFREQLPVSDAEVGVYQGLISSTAEYAPWTPLWQVAAELEAALGTRLADRDHLAALELLRLTSPKSAAKAGSAVTMMDKNGPGHLCLTYLERPAFPDKLGAWRISGAQFVAGMSVCGFVSATATALNGELAINLGYVEPAVSAERAERLADETVRGLLGAL